ncbi:MAG: PEP-CTERM sorting domain-containing protein [Planctomycetes bacterium]|nr:PEP-CTERM sorting domain-containing protein [Planctomycetota bacterium]
MFRVISLCSITILYGLASNALALEVFWDGEGGDDLWSTAANWSDDTVPTSADFARNPLADSTMLIDGTVSAEVAKLDFGIETGPTTLNITGGTLDVLSDGVDAESGSVRVGFGGGTIADATASTLNISGGVMTTESNLFIGFNGSATLNMTGGEVKVGGTMVLNEVTFFGGKGHVQLDGGTIEANLILLKQSGTMDVTGGKLLYGSVLGPVPGAFDNIDDLVSNGLITAYGGTGTIVVRSVPHSGNIIAEELAIEVTAIPTTGPLPGDFDSSGDVTGSDFLAWQRGFGIPVGGGASISDGDANGDGGVDAADLALWGEFVGARALAGPGPAVAAVPEPSSAMLLMFGLVAGQCYVIRKCRSFA